MLGSKLKSWMESQVAKVRVTKQSPWKRENRSSSSVPSSCSNDTSILLGAGSSMGSFTHNLSSPDTGYSTDGCSPKSTHLPAFTPSQVTKTTMLTQAHQNRPPNPLLATFISPPTNIRTSTESPQKPPRLSKLKPPEPAGSDTPKPDGNRSSFADSGHGSTLSTNRHSGESFQYKFPNINEEPRETEILSDWAPTDEDVDEGVLTPTPTPPPSQRSPKRGEGDQLIRTAELGLPKAYETLQLLNQCNHVFPLPSCTGPRCLEAQMDHTRVGSSRKRGRFAFIKKLFKRKSFLERDLPENSRGKPIRPGPAGYWLTPTPNSFRKRSSDYSSTTVPKGVKSDIIRIPQTTPTTLPNTATPTHIVPTRDSPFLSRLNSTTASPASVRFKPQPQAVTPLHPSPRPILAFASEDPPQRLPAPPPPPSRIQPPCYNNYSPIHRLVVTTSVHHHRTPESPLVRTHQYASRPPPPPPPRQTVTTPVLSRQTQSRFQYVPSSNQNSPVLNKDTPRRLSVPTVSFEPKHYYASPLAGPLNSAQIPRLPPPPPPYYTGDVDRIYEKVEGTEISDEGDGEGGVYECDDFSWGDSEQSMSQGQESTRSSTHAPIPPPPPPRRMEYDPRVTPTAWKFSETELQLLENEADRKYKKLLWEAEALLRQFTVDNPSRPVTTLRSPRSGEPRQRVSSQRKFDSFDDYPPASDPLRRKTYDCWALRRLQQELALSCVSPPVLHRDRFGHNLHRRPCTAKHHHPVI